MRVKKMNTRKSTTPVSLWTPSKRSLLTPINVNTFINTPRQKIYDKPAKNMMYKEFRFESSSDDDAIYTQRKA